MKNFTSFFVAIALGMSASICHAQEPRTAMENDTIAVDNGNDTKVETSRSKEREKEYLSVPFEKPVVMALTFGKCINMGGHENSEWLGRRRGQTNELDWRFAYFFLRHWGMYVDCASMAPPLQVIAVPCLKNNWEQNSIRTMNAELFSPER